MSSLRGAQADRSAFPQHGGDRELEMIGLRQVLLELICYASDRGKPAVLNIHPERITELSKRGLIERRRGGYWITELGRGQCPERSVPEQELPRPAHVPDRWPVPGVQPGQVAS